MDPMLALAAHQDVLGTLAVGGPLSSLVCLP